MVSLCDTLDHHLGRQEEQGAQIAGSLERMSDGLSRLGVVAESHGDSLRAIVEQLEISSDRGHKLEDLVGHVTKLTEAQRQALAGLAQQVETVQLTDKRIALSLDGVRTAMTALGDSSSASADSLRQLCSDGRGRDEQLARLVETQGKRFVMLFVVTLVLAAVGIAATVLSLVL